VILPWHVRFRPFVVQGREKVRRPIGMATTGGLRVTRWIAAVSMATTALVGSAALASPALASPATDLAAATTSARVAAGLPALTVNAQLTAVAQAWANHLAAANVLSHNGALRTQVTAWNVLGENVGVAADIPTVQAAFMASAPHRANILDTRYTQVGVGSATSIYPACGCQVLWVVVDFRRPMTDAVAPVTPVKPVPAKPVPAKPVVKSVTTAPKGATAPTATQHVSPATIVGSTVAAPAPSAAPSAEPASTALQTHLAATASPDTTGSDPVGRMLNFATVVSQLPS